MRRTKTGFTPKQYAYAKNTLGGNGRSKKEIALVSGYSKSVAISVSEHIEKTEGFDNAMSALASESGNIMLAIFHRIKHHKNLDDADLPSLLKIVEVMGQAWERFIPKQKDNDTANKLRSIVLNRIENQTVNQTIKPVGNKPAEPSGK